MRRIRRFVALAGTIALASGSLAGNLGAVQSELGVSLPEVRAAATTEVERDASSSATTIGVYRWDAWHGGTSGIYTAMRAAMQPTKYANKLPFFATDNPDGSVEVDDTDAQWKMDEEIQYAAEGGVDYWAFLHYRDADSYHAPMNESLAAYKASAFKDQLNYTYLLSHELFESVPAAEWATIRSDLVGEMADPQWQRVLEDRPLIYVYADAASASLAGKIAQIRTDAIVAGLEDPYFVGINLASLAYGLDAQAPWSPAMGTASGAPWSTYADSVEVQNEQLLTAGAGDVVLGAHVNWDSRPYADTPPPWTSPAYIYSDMPTKNEYRDLVQSVVDDTQFNSDVAAANTIFVFAWNELAEGGIMVPTRTPTGVDTTILDGLSEVDKHGIPEPTSTNLALGRQSYASSSTIAAGQEAAKAFDGSPLTNWQAAGSSNEWLSVDFGTPTEVNAVSLSEYDGRISSFSIEAWNGTAWSPIFDGTRIGESKVIAFAPTTTTKLRLSVHSSLYTPIIYEFAAYGSEQNIALGRSGYTSSSDWSSSQNAGAAFDGLWSTNWQSSSTGFANQWLEVDFGGEATFGSVQVMEFGNRTSSYRIEYWDGAAWQTAHSGTGSFGTIGDVATITFPAVTGSKARLFFTSGVHTPIIYELEVLG